MPVSKRSWRVTPRPGGRPRPRHGAAFVRARQAVRGGYPNFDPIVEGLKSGRHRLLGGLLIPCCGCLAVWVAKGIRLIPVVRPDLPVLDGQAGQQPAAGHRERLAQQLPPIREVLRGHSAPELPAGYASVVHDARPQPPEVGLQYDGPAVAHHPRQELLGEAEVKDRLEQSGGGP